MTSEEKKETIDERRLTLINDPNYAIVLSFLEKFRSILDLPIYSFQRLEDHLLQTDQRLPPRLIDFHFILLKRLSLAKNTQREKFDSIITKFVSRFDLDDTEHLTTNGYLQTDIRIKIRILKNLLESQFDLNQTLKNTLIDQSARDLKCVPLGRDRFGVSYWFFMDTDCFVRLFREDVDVDRNWTSVAKNRDELENFIRLLITDSVVRKKFADWSIDYEPLASLTPSNDFEERFLPTLINVKIEGEEVKEAIAEEDPIEVAPKKKRGRPRGSTKISAENSESMEIEVKKEEKITNENDDEDLSTKKRRGRRSTTASLKPVEVKEEPVVKEVEPMKPKRGRGRPSLKEVKQERAESVSYDDEPAEPTAKKRRGRPARNSKKSPIHPKSDSEEEETIATTRRGRKRKNPIDETTVEENPSASVRRSSRARKTPTIDLTPTVVTSKSKKKRTTNGKTKGSSTDGRSTRRRKTTSKRNPDDRFCLSSSSSDDCNDYLSEDDDDDEFDRQSEDYLPDPSDFDLVEEPLFDVDEETNSTAEGLRSAKTAQASTIITTCRVCEKSDRPEVLLLCDDCDDAYHIECLRPALLSVPDGDWFCPLCEHKKLSDQLINKLKELLLQYQQIEEKRQERLAKQTTERKIRPKEYSSDESVTASESEEETTANIAAAAIQSQEDESMLSASQTNENSNLSSSNFEETNKNISQRGRHRRTRFDMSKMLNDPDGSDDNSQSNDDEEEEEDDEYRENTPQMTNFDLQLPKKMTRLLNYRYRPVSKMEVPSLKPRPIRPRPTSQTGIDTNENLDSSLNYVNGDASTIRPIKSMVNNSKQTLKIVRRWNDVQRRSRLKITNTMTSTLMRNRQETTSDCADENSVFCPDDSSPPRSNESQPNADLKDEDSTIIRSKITLIQPVNSLPIPKNSNRNLLRKTDVTFDRLTRDIQYAVSEANTLSTVSKTIDQQQVKRIQRTNFSPYSNKVAVRPLPVLLPKPASIGYKIFKSKDPPLPSSTSTSSSHSTSTTTDLSNIMLTPSSSSSLMDNNDDPTGSTMNS